MQLHRYWTGSSTSSPLEVRTIPYRSQTLLKTWAFSWIIPSHPPSIAKRLLPKQRRMLIMIGRSFVELSVSAFAHIYSTLVRPHLEYANAGLLAEPCCWRWLFGANPAVGDEARKGFPPTAIWRKTTSAGSALLTQASPPWRPQSRIKNIFWGIGSGPRPPFYSASVAWLEGSSFQISAGS